MQYPYHSINVSSPLISVDSQDCYPDFLTVNPALYLCTPLPPYHFMDFSLSDQEKFPGKQVRLELTLTGFSMEEGAQEAFQQFSVPIEASKKMTKYFSQDLFNFVPRLVHNSDHLVLEASLFLIFLLWVFCFFNLFQDQSPPYSHLHSLHQSLTYFLEHIPQQDKCTVACNFDTLRNKRQRHFKPFDAGM